MRRMIPSLVLALSLLGCDARVLPWDQVALRTSDTDTHVTCWLAGMEGELIVDPQVGLAWMGDPGDIRPVVWPRGYIGRRVGSEVEVLDRVGNVVATTGWKGEITYSKMEGGLVYACEGSRLFPAVRPT